MNAVGYFRRTTGAKGDTIGRQNRLFLDYCEAQGFEVAVTFSEDSPESQQAFAQLLEYLKRPEKGFMIVVTPSIAVLADDPTIAATRCLQVERLGAQVHFVDGDGDALGEIVDGWTSDEDSELREKVRTALRKKAVRGEVLGRPPYGYRVGAKNRLEVVDDEAVVVRYIFRLYLHEGLGIRLIARRLNEEGNLTRRQRPWSMVTIRDILRNRAYLGTYQRLTMIVPGTHPAIVTPEEFRRVQDMLQDRRTNYSPRKVSGFLLSGLARCGNCGNRMIGVSRKQAWTRRRDGSEQVASYRYYQCESRTNQGICAYHTRRAEELEETVKERLIELDPSELADDTADGAETTHWKDEAKRLNDRLTQLDRRFSRSLGDAAAEKLSRERLRSEGLVVAEERLKLEEELRDARWRAEHYDSATERRRTRKAVLNLAVGKWDVLAMPELQQLLREIIDHISVKDESIEVVLRP